MAIANPVLWMTFVCHYHYQHNK